MSFRETTLADVPPHVYPVLILSNHGLLRPASVTLQTPVPDRVPSIQTLILYPTVFSMPVMAENRLNPSYFHMTLPILETSLK